MAENKAMDQPTILWKVMLLARSRESMGLDL